MSDYRVHIKVRNARLLRAIEQAGHQPEQIFARLAGISYAGHLLSYLNLKRTPFDENGDLRPCAEKLCVFLNRLPDELWSEEQRYPLVTNTSEVELSGASVQEWLSGPASCADPLVLLEQREGLQAVDALLDTLTEREADILRMRFGIDCEPTPLEDVAKAKGCTRERIRQIEMKALTKLRNPTRRAEVVAASLGFFGRDA